MIKTDKKKMTAITEGVFMFSFSSFLDIGIQREINIRMYATNAICAYLVDRKDDAIADESSFIEGTEDI